MDIFGIKIEFDKDAFRNILKDGLNKSLPGYVCVVDGNVLSMTHRDENYRQIVRNAYVNTCDGSSIAAMANRLYGTDYRAYTGPEIFADYIDNPVYSQVLLGNTVEKFDQIVGKLRQEGKYTSHLVHIPLPFSGIDEFDYEGIASMINAIGADIIWVSLGAPKQEMFMSRILPFLNSGLMFGIGAAFNFYVGDISQPNMRVKALRFNWLIRIFKEPQKQLRRVWGILKAYPAIYMEEKKRSIKSLPAEER